MALEKRISEDRIEFVGAARSLQIRELTEVLDDGVVISHSFHRRVLSPCKREDGEWVPNDLPDESPYIQGIADAAWDDDARAAFIAQYEQGPLLGN